MMDKLAFIISLKLSAKKTSLIFCNVCSALASCE